MSAEQTLLTHWRACVETRDPVCLRAFADHLMELWSQAVDEDSAFYSETGAVAPVLRLIHGDYQFNMDHDDIEGNVALRLFRWKSMQSTTRMNRLPSPAGWDYHHCDLFTSVLQEFLGPPTTLPERTSTPTGDAHG